MQKIGVYQSAYAHIMGRATYEAMAGALPTAEWANTTIAELRLDLQRCGVPSPGRSGGSANL
jgi:hypothetical protein